MDRAGGFGHAGNLRRLKKQELQTSQTVTILRAQADPGLVAVALA